MYRPHPFSWVPADGQRHATADVRPPGGFSTGLVVETLCGQQVQADNSDMAWLWETCPTCNVRAHELAGIPMARPRIGAR
ncbi:zinc finger protein [Saccharopolyspora rosea]|uniref:zinc finger protein n=1 Tax=Saccharopolyspora rosea TaxID=524884 RepID=UPI0021D83A8A|nr:zinc finger protein [Saccharopolyspora rosea]